MTGTVTFEKRRPDSTTTEIIFEDSILDQTNNRVLLEISGVVFNIQGIVADNTKTQKFKLREKTEQVAKVAAGESGAARKIP